MRFPVPRVMSTQHPDNVQQPFFAEHDVMSGEDEVQEAFYAFSHLGCGEQLWDAEGKEVDSFVVKKLLTKYEPFFRKRRLGEERILSLRVPNPRVERSEAKILIEALHSITRSHDVSAAFYGDDAPAPIPQVYLPMTRDASEVLRVKEYYDEMIIKAQERSLLGMPIKRWIGPFKPETVRVTPLVEERDAILGCATIAEELIGKKAMNGDPFLRFWFARSDPALNYGSAATVLMLKVALQRLHEVERRTSVEILPIIGLGSAPFRGGFTPASAGSILRGYPSMQTFTAQSSFKYDHPVEETKAAIGELNEAKRKPPVAVDEEALLPIIEKLSRAYEEQVRLVAPLANRMAQHVPSRRKRKLHIGLFGYSRESGGVTLPRAIKYTGAMYSLGLPPELLGLHALNERELDVLRDAWRNFDADHAAAARFLNAGNLALFPQRIQDDVRAVMARFPVEADHDHQRITTIIRESFAKERAEQVKEDVVRAAFVRGFLG